MPPLPLLPNQPAGVPDWYSSSGTTSSTAPISSSTSPRFYATDNGPVTLPSDWSQQDAQQWVAAYNQYIAKLTESAQQTSGLQRKQIEAQIADATRGRDNAMQIAQLQADTSRYGTDANKETQLAQLKQNQQQFNQTHALALQQFGLSQQQFGLDYAKAATTYESTPDMRWSAADFDSAIARGNQGLGPRPIGANPDNPNAPVPKSYDDFSVLANYGPGGSGTGVGGGASRSSGQGATNANGGPATPTGTGSTADPRVSAANAIMKAIPPSAGAGHDDQDWAALGAIKNLYFSGGPGSVERLGAARQKIANAGLARMGYDPQLVNEDYQRRGIGQGSTTAYA